MKNRSRWVLMSSVLLGGALLSACGSSSSTSSDKVSLSINYYNGAISDTAIENAKKEFPDYELNFKQIPANGDFDTKLKASLNSKSAPDITAINSNIADYIPYSDRFVNLLDYGTADLAKDYVEWKWDSCFTNDKSAQIAMPIDIGPTALFYNVEAFKKAGLPTDDKSVSELLSSDEKYMEAAKQMKEKADMPMFQSSLSLLQQRYRAMTKHIYDKDGNLIYADGELKKAWDYAVMAEKNGYTLGAKGNSADGANSVQRGLFGGMIEASWGINDLAEDGASPEQWLIAKSPFLPSNYGGSYLAVIKTTAHPKEAAEVVKYLTNEESQRVNYKELALFPANKKVFDDEFANVKHELFGNEQYNHYFIEAANALEYIPFDPRESAAFECFENQMTLVAEQGKDPEQAWNDAMKKVEEISK
ncbi:ABC transporter substrate-binding protein [Streptococcus cuniculi]|uniref:ABC transporter substrate-binding protein n=1 Tax=Streptococcus cuniculi TaxID=1432788 RepID=A0A1Q8E747_9STRE|nr:extracellular solute-binding protein [Streptococcus cuniculi]OLF47606.1 ABC transporter substrate-binding protein [Streptococcus cuniculi]